MVLAALIAVLAEGEELGFNKEEPEGGTPIYDLTHHQVLGRAPAFA